jgi:hypothetical protein
MLLCKILNFSLNLIITLLSFMLLSVAYWLNQFAVLAAFTSFNLKELRGLNKIPLEVVKKKRTTVSL